MVPPDRVQAVAVDVAAGIRTTLHRVAKLVRGVIVLAVVVGLAMRDVIPWWIALSLPLRDLLLWGLVPLLRTRGYSALPVHFLGKAATFNLLYAFPLLLLGGVGTALGIVIGLAWIAVVSVVVTTLSGIVSIALYRYAVDGDVPGFGTDQLRAAFRPRKRGLSI